MIAGDNFSPEIVIGDAIHTGSAIKSFCIKVWGNLFALGSNFAECTCSLEVPERCHADTVGSQP